MESLIGLKNIVIFSVILLTIGSVSAQQAFAGNGCQSDGNGDWSDSNNWDFCNGPTPNSSDDVTILSIHDIEITGDEEAKSLSLSGTLFIGCDASLTIIEGGGNSEGDITNHGTFTASGSVFTLFDGTLFNSGTLSGIVIFEEDANIEEISTIWSQPIGGTVGSMSTTSLLVAGAQANLGLWSLALVGIVGAGAAITYKLKSKKTEQ